MNWSLLICDVVLIFIGYRWGKVVARRDTQAESIRLLHQFLHFLKENPDQLENLKGALYTPKKES